ncbi:hypothetical protein QFZ22_001000 [Streptomyces canus]|uniref:Uncharacterized protein n=1 Tax=Streptomyces canus TaxID=58343 RepID=A0AAW8F7A4_9ACTN|nr:hypothetical protein [Streptomyces canus]MDQ0905015.1 hypothetical protein [Streptomyces canus]
MVAKLERYDAYRNAPAGGRGNAARAPRSHCQEIYAAVPGPALPAGAVRLRPGSAALPRPPGKRPSTSAPGTPRR